MYVRNGPAEATARAGHPFPRLFCLPASVPFCPPLCSPPVLLWTYSRLYSRTDRTAELPASGSGCRSVAVHFRRRLTEPDCCRFLPTDYIKRVRLYRFCFLVVFGLRQRTVRNERGGSGLPRTCVKGSKLQNGRDGKRAFLRQQSKRTDQVNNFQPSPVVH